LCDSFFLANLSHHSVSHFSVISSQSLINFFVTRLRFLNQVSALGLGFIFLPLALSAAFELERGVYAISELKEAQKEAREKGKAISFLYSNTETTCGLCDRASLVIMDEMNGDTVMVYTRSASDAPKIVFEAFRSPESGKYIPKFAAFDAELTRLLGVVSYMKIKEENDDAFEAVEDAIDAYEDELKNKENVAFQRESERKLFEVGKVNSYTPGHNTRERLLVLFAEVEKTYRVVGAGTAMRFVALDGNPEAVAMSAVTQQNFTTYLRNGGELSVTLNGEDWNIRW